MRLALPDSAAVVVSYYAETAADGLWPEIAPLACWNGSALVFDKGAAEHLWRALNVLANHYDAMAEGEIPPDFDSRRFCRDASRGLTTAAWKVGAIFLA